jgi:hypothetical protein
MIPGPLALSQERDIAQAVFGAGLPDAQSLTPAKPAVSWVVKQKLCSELDVFNQRHLFPIDL